MMGTEYRTQSRLSLYYKRYKKVRRQYEIKLAFDSLEMIKRRTTYHVPMCPTFLFKENLLN